MAKQVINIGSTGNDLSGDNFRVSFDKCNDNFTELYDYKDDDTGWIEPGSLSNGWNVYTSSWFTFGYRLDNQGFVHLRGMLKDGTGALIYTLPAGYRPQKNIYHPTLSNNGGLITSIVQVTSAGAVNAVAYGSVWFTISSLYFEAYQ